MSAQDHQTSHYRRATIIWVGKDRHVETSATIVSRLEQVCPPDLVCEGEAIWIFRDCQNMPAPVSSPKKRTVNDAA